MLYIKVNKNPVPANFFLDKELEIYYASFNIKAQHAILEKGALRIPIVPTKWRSALGKES